MKGSDDWLLHALNSKPLCGECVGIMPSDEPPPAWSLNPSSQEGVLGKISKLRGNLCANF